MKKKALKKIWVTALLVMMNGCYAKNTAPDNTIRIGVSVYDQYDVFISELMDRFNKNAEAEDGKVIIEVRDAEQSQNKQNQEVEALIEEGCDVICVNLVDRTAPTKIIDLARKNDIPIIFFNRELVEEDLLRWEKLYYVGADATESGIMQGEIAAAAIKADPSVDKNGDGVIQYIMLEGESRHQDTIVRSEYSVSTLEDNGVKLEKLSYAIANWNRIQAQTKVIQAYDEYGELIELVLANNDEMALGAIDAYKALDIVVDQRPLIFGIDGTSAGLEAVKEGLMAGTVNNDSLGQADAMYKLAISLASGDDLSSLELTDGKYIRLPYEKITAENVDYYISLK